MLPNWGLFFQITCWPPPSWLVSPSPPSPVEGSEVGPGALGGGVLDLHLTNLGAAEQAADSLSIFIVREVSPHKSLGMLWYRFFKIF